ncbi:hypothetical protein WN943_025459 [Citrus x changshan-huyou]
MAANLKTTTTDMHMSHVYTLVNFLRETIPYPPGICSITHFTTIFFKKVLLPLPCYCYNYSVKSYYFLFFLPLKTKKKLSVNCFQFILL